jgi:superfamily II DNA or RNA helicase
LKKHTGNELNLIASLENLGSNFRLRRSLWPHQAEALAVAEQFLHAQRGRFLFQLPTGSGKGVLIRYIAYLWLAESNRNRVLLVFPSEEVLGQFRQEIELECALPYTVEKAASQGQSYSRLVLASQNTLWNRIGKYERDRLCIFDECHHENLHADRNIELVQKFGLVFGFSATPWSPGCETVFAKVHYSYPLSRSIEENICSPYRIEPWPADASPQGTHELFFCETNRVAQKAALQVPFSDSLTYESRSDGSYEWKMQSFRDGVLKRMYCNRMLTEGFDDKRIATVYIGKETKSDILNYQMVGRALRYQPSKVARIYCIDGPCAQRVEGALRRAG